MTIDLKQLLLKLLQNINNTPEAVEVEDFTSQITHNISNLTINKAYKYGNVCHIAFTYLSSTTIDAGDDVFSSTLTNPYPPLTDAHGCGYYGRRSFICWYQSEANGGGFILRNASSDGTALNGNGGLRFSITYICA